MYFDVDDDDADSLAGYIAEIHDAKQFKEAQCVYECASATAAGATAVGRIWLGGFWPTQDVRVRSLNIRFFNIIV